MPNFNNTRVITTEAVAVAIALYQRNNQRVHLFKKNGPPSTKSLMLEHFSGKSIPNLNLTEAEELQKVLQHAVLMSALSNKNLPNFFHKLNDLLVYPTVSLRDLGLVAWAPHVRDRIAKTQTVDEELNKYSYRSRHFGSVHQKVTLKLTIINQQYVSYFDTFNYTAVTEQNNIVKFYCKKDFSGTIDVTAKIKHHTVEKNTDITDLSFVKKSQ